MTLDLWVFGILGLFALLGALSGAVKQAAQWVALTLAYACGKPLTEALGPGAPGLLPLPPAAAPVALRVAVMLAIFLVAGFAARLVVGKLIGDGALSGANRAAGAGLGAAKGGVLAWVLLSVLVAFEKPLAKTGWDLDKKVGESHALAFTRRHSLMDAVRWSVLDGAKKLAAARSDPKAAAELMNDPAVKAALEDPELKAVFEDPKFREALQSLDAGALLRDPRIRKLLENPDLAKKLDAIGRQP